MYCYVTLIDEEGMQEVIDSLTYRINAFSKRHPPFKVVAKEEELSESFPVPIQRLHLGLTSDFEIKSDKQARIFAEKVKEAAADVEHENQFNFVLMGGKPTFGGNNKKQGSMNRVKSS